jgi:ATP-dependent RNA helicase DDX19/DBP5
MCPTRELVVQNLEVVRKLATHTEVTSIGTNEMQSGRRQPPITQQIVIGTAGKLKSMIASRLLGLDGIRILVFDEADQMLSTDGFQESSIQMISMLRRVAPDVQFLLFSATFDDHVKNYCRKVSNVLAPQPPWFCRHAVNARVIHSLPTHPHCER